MKKLFFWILAVFSLPLVAQDLSNFLPTDATAVVAFKEENYGKKINFDKIKASKLLLNYDKTLQDRFPQEYETISQIYKNSVEAGVNLNPNSFAFIQDMDSLMAFAYIFNVSDANKFENFSKSYTKTLTTTIEFGKKNSYQYFKNDNFVVAWNKKIGIVLGLDGTDSSTEEVNYEDSLYYQKLEAQQQAFKEEKQRLAFVQIDKVFGLNQSNSLQNNSNFKEFLAQKYDIGVWSNFEDLNKLYTKKSYKGIESVPYLGSYFNVINSFYKNSFWHFYIYLNNGEALVESNFYTSSDIAKSLNGLNSQRIDPTLFRYINAKKTLMAGAISVNMKKFGENFWKIYEPMIKEEQNGKQVEAVLDLLSIAIDEEALTSLFSGDLLFAITDIKEVDVTYTTYEYDDDYNMITVEKKQKEKRPVFMIASKIGNKPNIEKIIKAFVNFKTAIPEQDYYVFAANKGNEVYMALKDNILLIGNDENNIKNALKGLPATDQIPLELQRQMLSNPQFYYINLEQSLNEAESFSPIAKDKIGLVKNKLKDISITIFEPVGNISKSELRLVAKDNSQNIVNILVDLFEEK